MKSIKKNLLLLGVICLLCINSGSVHAQIYINEISICNVNKELDPNYDYSGWIELYNSSDKDINLKDLYFSDDAEQPLKYKLSNSRTLPAKGYAAVWLNDELTDSKTGYFLDTDADDGGYLSVSDKNGKVYDSMAYGEQFPNVSSGRLVDGDISSPLVFFTNGTFCKSNNGAETGTEVISTPELSEKSGFYKNEVKVKITCATEGAQIYYTTDASEPTTTKSKLYSGEEIVISSTTTLRARAFKSGLLNGLIANATYMINERKPESLPVVFLTTAPENLNDDMIGIYCIGKNGIKMASQNPVANYNRDWTRWAYIELQDELRNVTVSQPIGIGISGNASRGFPQKAFKIKGKSKHGKKRFDVALFPMREGVRYKSFILRAGGQYENTVQLIHDSCIESLADVTSLDYQAATPAVVYLNGEYWGIYNLRERKNKDMVYSNYGLSETDFDMVEFVWKAIPNNGNLDSWKEFEAIVKSSDFTKNEDYSQICKLMDIDNYLYYMSIEFLAKNSDWPNNNQILFRPHAEGSKWRWILQDLDRCLQGDNSVNKLKGLIESESQLLSTKLIVYLLNNNQFKDEYITVQSLVAGSVYEPERFKTRLITMKDAIAAEYPYYQAKWTEQGGSNLEKTVQKVIKNEAAACSEIFKHMKENFSLGNIHGLIVNSTHSNTPILFNRRQIPVLPYNGKWFEGKVLQLQAPLYDQGRKFAYWELKSPDGSTQKSMETTLELFMDKDSEITAIYQPSEMARRNGLFINEISADNASSVDNAYKYEDWIEIYNSSDAPIDLAGYYISNNKDKPTLFQFSDTDPEQTIVPAGGYKIIWCSKKTERGIMHTNFKLGKDGESVYLYRPDNQGSTVLVDSVRYAAHDATTSFGRYPNGSETLMTLSTPTFKAMNQYSIYNVDSYTEEFPLVGNVHEINTDLNRPIVYKISDAQLYVKCTDGKVLKIVSLNGSVLKNVSLTQEESYISIEDCPKGINLIVIESGTERWGYKIIL